MRIWFTSDQHFWHKNVIEYCQRPHENIDEMNRDLISRWNSMVGENDTVYTLGDFAFSGMTKIEAIVGQLKGRKRLIQGNHDWHSKPQRWIMAGFEDVQDSAEVDGFLLSHFPYLNGGDYVGYKERFQDKRLHDAGFWLLHGHVHNAWKVKGHMINVGVDVWNYFPVSLDQLKFIRESGEV